MPEERYRHIFLENSAQTRGFTSPSSGGSKKRIPHRGDPERHSTYLNRKFSEAWQLAENERAVVHRARSGVYIEFKSDPGAELVTRSLEDLRSKKVRLLNVRNVPEEDVFDSSEPRAHSR